MFYVLEREHSANVFASRSVK